MKLLIDMNISPKLALLLCAEKHDCKRWSEVGRADAPDEEIVDYARRENCVIITKDLDFGTILARNFLDLPSVLLIRRKDVLADALFPMIDQVLAAFESELHTGALIVVDERRTRIRMLPLR